ncbi:hypothetical protein AX774_g5847 [Zancudomyces culisetae]|uniref:Uncharacterized protein n=1 Tax=Zancudomyces culisetae TaxID=1213189 RepID=A0A1R1PIE3_ZANCU|nr:hypothetical protein AX774_g5847 [Zancudomyces culisetae]|eukprot:OMH80708.1 hypothetical protein AX774_g5847 [Zancudomyces culisetae]
MRRGPFADVTTGCLNTTPLDKNVSSSVPPASFTILMSFSETSPLCVAGLTLDTRSTESTAIGANVLEYWLTIFEPSDVVAHLSSVSRSSPAIFTSKVPICSIAYSLLFLNPSTILVGCTPLPSSFSLSANRLPANTTTEVVPSPASASCACDKSTNIRAAG